MDPSVKNRVMVETILSTTGFQGYRRNYSAGAPLSKDRGVYRHLPQRQERKRAALLNGLKGFEVCPRGKTSG
jgi:hypothetical protein